MAKDGVEVRDRLSLRVGLRVGGYTGGRVTPGVVGDYLVAAGEGPDLGIPAAVVPGELVAQDEGEARAGDLVIDIHSIYGYIGHGVLPTRLPAIITQGSRKAIRPLASTTVGW